LNGAAVEFNRQSFTWGRYAAHDLAKVESLAFPPAVVKTLPFPQSLAKMREAHEAFLTAYQNQALANRYHHWVEHVQAAEERVKPGSRHLTRAAARSYFNCCRIKTNMKWRACTPMVSLSPNCSNSLKAISTSPSTLAPAIYKNG